MAVPAAATTASPPSRPSPPVSSDSGRPRRSPQKPQTPRSTRSSTHGVTTVKAEDSPTKPPSPSRPRSETKKRKPIFVSCVNFPENGPAPPPNATQDGGELQRSQRKSKVEAINKLDRAGTPTAVAGPTATSFVPPPPPVAGPSIQRNPLKAPRIVNPPFDLDSVRTKAPADPGPSSEPRLFGIPTCPTYHPTHEQFRDPMAYIDSIAPEASRYGICKIVPPDGWHMPFRLDTDSFRFMTRLQRLNSIEAASRAKINFLEQLSMYHKQQGDATAHIPRIEHKLLDLWRLRKEVNKLGGIDEVNRLSAWPKITEELGYTQSSTGTVKMAYTRIVQPFEAWARRAKSVPASPLTPVPSTNGKMTGTVGSPLTPVTPTANLARTSGMRHTPRSRMTSVKPPTAGPSPLTAMSLAESPLAGPSSAADVPNGSLAPPAKIRINLSALRNNAEIARGPGSDSELSDDSSLSSLSSTASTPEQAAPPPEKYEKGDVCEVCGLGNNAPKILLCDGCDRGFHTFCLDPPLAGIPSNEWFCTACLLGNGDDYGFDEGEEHSLPSFQARDAAFTQEWFNRYAPTFSPAGPHTRQLGAASVSEADVEREFWRLVESQDDTVEVEYGADVHSTTHGSAAPTLETHPTDPYARDPWNLNNMPILSDSLLRYIKSDISGMTVPWIYVGMLFSAFCWHNEDHYTYSVNYMFWGETKTWYGIPGGDAQKFEAAIKREAPELFERQPSLLYQLVTIMNPGRLVKEGVDVFACDQRPNEFVITFPKAYHCGFNHGLNFNEAVNFALPDWLPAGRESVLTYKQHAKPPVFSHNELLITITLYSDTIKTALWLQDSLKEMVDAEAARRGALRDAVPDINETLVEEDVPEAGYQCCVCKGFCYLTQITCPCTQLVACMDHGELLCGCPWSKKTMRKRLSENQLQDILEAVVSRAAQPVQWQARFDALLESPRPSYKALRLLVAEGERILHPLPGLPDLRAFVDRVSNWMERATGILTRKSIVRRQKKGRQSETTPVEVDYDRRPEAVAALLEEADKLAFDAPEIAQLRQTMSGVMELRKEVDRILALPEDDVDTDQLRTAVYLGRDLHVQIPEMVDLERLYAKFCWYDKVEKEFVGGPQQYEFAMKLVQESEELDVREDDETLQELKEYIDGAHEWQRKAEALLESPSITLDDISDLVDTDGGPSVFETMKQLETIRKTVQTWQTSATTILASGGTVAAAQRLCKAVRGAQGPLSRIIIPEIARLQVELDYHATWQAALGKVLRQPPSKVPNYLSNMMEDLENHLAPTDEEPNEKHSCFCRKEPVSVMIRCPTCQGDYHPKCVGLAAKTAAGVKAASATFECQMCAELQYDDRVSFNSIANFVDPVRFNFLLKPAEFELIQDAVAIVVRYAQHVVPYLGRTAPRAMSKKEVTLIYHLLRKIWTLSVQLDCASATQLFVIDDWLRSHLQHAPEPAVARPGRTRARKPQFTLEGAHPREFSCICRPDAAEPLDHLLTVQCSKCGQGFHLSCVKAPISVANNEGRGGWHCPFCTVKAGKVPSRGIDVRVQMEYDLGTDKYVDWRQTLFVYSDLPIIKQLPENRDAVVLTCTKFKGPALPEGFERPVWTEAEESQRRRRGGGPRGPRKSAPAPMAPASAASTPAPHIASAPHTAPPARLAQAPVSPTTTPFRQPFPAPPPLGSTPVPPRTISPAVQARAASPPHAAPVHATSPHAAPPHTGSIPVHGPAPRAPSPPRATAPAPSLQAALGFAAPSPVPATSTPSLPRPSVNGRANGPNGRAPLENVPAQNVRANGRVYYPTHTIVPWENSSMFSQFQLPGDPPHPPPAPRARPLRAPAILPTANLEFWRPSAPDSERQGDGPPSERQQATTTAAVPTAPQRPAVPSIPPVAPHSSGPPTTLARKPLPSPSHAPAPSVTPAKRGLPTDTSPAPPAKREHVPVVSSPPPSTLSASPGVPAPPQTETPQS